MSVKLEISLGEAIDKLTILDIKKGKINDVRKMDVEHEFEYLLSVLNTYVMKYNYYYAILKRTNLEIWELQDILRSKNCEQSNYYVICDEILNLNDSRYLVKKKINEICKSNLKEQKGYSLRILNVILNCDIDTINILNGAIRYYSFFYDEVKLLSRSENIILLNQTFNDDPFIKINAFETSSADEYSKDDDCVTVNNSDIKVKLLHSFFSKNNNSNNSNNSKNNNTYDNTYSKEINDIYRKLGMNVSIFDDYNHVDCVDK
jgi:hypothetical protein